MSELGNTDTVAASNHGATDRYTHTAMALHWLVAILIVGGFGLGWVMTDIPGITPTKLKYYSWHKWIGVTVFFLAIVRGLWRITHEVPVPPRMPAWQAKIAGATHALLYALMFLVPTTGYLYSSASNIPIVYLGIIPLPRLIDPSDVLKPVFKAAHISLDYALLVLVLLHLFAALKHHFIDRDDVLLRMLSFSRRSS